MRRRTWERIAWLLLASAALGQAGCLAVAAGCAAGGAAGFAYYSGKVERDYVAYRQDVWAALQAALADLRMPVTEPVSEGTEWSLEARTADGDKVRITLETKSSRIPSEGVLTRVGVRVATFGDGTVSSRILDQIGFHLTGLPAGTPPPPPVPVTLNGPGSVGAPLQTAPPPLAAETNKK
jgi:hypothetical protein